jgi:8-oxo-dGTP diphosphatase
VTTPTVVVAVGAIIRRGDAVLLVQRGRAPAAGKWSVPGGRVEFGETLAAAVVREVQEETGLSVAVDRFAGWVERIGDEEGLGPFHHVIADFFVTEAEPRGEARPGDDAVALQWVPISALDDVELVDGLADFLRSVGVRTEADG